VNALESNTSVTSIDVGMNAICAEGRAALTKALTANAPTTFLDAFSSPDLCRELVRYCNVYELGCASTVTRARFLDDDRAWLQMYHRTWLPAFRTPAYASAKHSTRVRTLLENGCFADLSSKHYMQHVYQRLIHP
jgi:hypothetical protein